jgi:hypothetical protein
MERDTELIHQDDVCDCGSALDCWEGKFPDEGYRYTKWICQKSDLVVADRHDYFKQESIGEEGEIMDME